MVEVIANVYLYGQRVGAVAWLSDKGYAVFEYDPAFIKSGINLSPIHMPLRKNTGYAFPNLNFLTFKGLPGLLADALPDKFGDDLINIWLAQKGLSSSDFNPVQRLCYQGTRGMGALEFYPLLEQGFDTVLPIEITHLLEITQNALARKNNLDVYFTGSETDKQRAMAQILSVSTSAGGARPKAVLAINNQGHILSGQASVPDGYEHWLLKFDGVTDSELGLGKDYGKIEYAYYLMAKHAGIDMMLCDLLEEHGRSHFLTKRFDRISSEKRHIQTLCGLCHYDYNNSGAYSYEQVFAAMRQLNLSKAEAEQQFKRMVFNVIARNQDDHSKNISFIMDKTGKWRLSPAYDVTYSHNPAGQWTNQHQMSINGKRDHFTRTDFRVIADSIGLNLFDDMIDNMIDVIADWPVYAKEAGLNSDRINKISAGHRIGEFRG